MQDKNQQLTVKPVAALTRQTQAVDLAQDLELLRKAANLLLELSKKLLSNEPIPVIQGDILAHFNKPTIQRYKDAMKIALPENASRYNDLVLVVVKSLFFRLMEMLGLGNYKGVEELQRIAAQIAQTFLERYSKRFSMSSLIHFVNTWIAGAEPFVDGIWKRPKELTAARILNGAEAYLTYCQKCQNAQAQRQMSYQRYKSQESAISYDQLPNEVKQVAESLKAKWQAQEAEEKAKQAQEAQKISAFWQEVKNKPWERLKDYLVDMFVNPSTELTDRIAINRLLELFLSEDELTVERVDETLNAKSTEFMDLMQKRGFVNRGNIAENFEAVFEQMHKNIKG